MANTEYWDRDTERDQWGGTQRDHRPKIDDLEPGVIGYSFMSRKMRTMERSASKEHCEAVLRAAPWLSLGSASLLGGSLFFGMPRVPVIGWASLVGICVVPGLYLYWKSGRPILFFVMIAFLVASSDAATATTLEVLQFLLTFLGACNIGLWISKRHFKRMLG